MIEFRNVDFSYGDKPVLKNVSFSIGDDEAVVIMGPSGSGKSTCLRLILGLEDVVRGEIHVDSKNIGSMKRKQKQQMRKNIGMVFQDGALFDSMTVGENVGYYLIEHSDLRWSDIAKKVREMLGYVGLDADDLIDKLPEELSGGMQRRVAIGRALLSTNPKVMLYDEPTTGLDPQSSEKVLRLITRLHQEHTLSSIVVTHQIADAFSIADRFIVILAGELVFDGSLVDLRDSRDTGVMEFLAPFRDSMAGVVERKFVAGD